MPAYPQKHNMFVPLGGLKTDTDDKLLPLGRALELENVNVKRLGAQDGTIEAIKRFGTTALPSFANTPGQMGTHRGALVNVGTLLTTLATAAASACSPVASSDLRPAISAELTRIASGALTSDLAYGGGYYWIVYSDSVNLGAPTLLHMVAVDEATGHRAFETTAAPAGGATSFAAWRVVYVAGRAVFVWHDQAGAINFLSVDPAGFATTTNATAAGVGIGGAYNLYWFDVSTRGGTTVMVAFPDAGLIARAYDVVPSSLALTAWTPRTAAAATIPVASLGWMEDPAGSGKVALITADAANGLRVQWDLPTAGATRDATATHVIDAAFTGASAFLCGNTTGSAAGGEYLLVYDQGALPNRVIYKATRIGGVVAAGATIARNSFLVSKTWTSGGDYFVAAGHDSATGQGTHYVLRAPVGPVFSMPTPHCKIGVRQGIGGTLGRMSGVASPRAGQFTFGLNYTPRFDTVPNPNLFGVQLATVTHHALPYSRLGKPREAIESMFAPGGTVGQFDGVRFAEAGFAYPPEQPTLTPSNAGGSMTAGATYYYAIVYMYTDAQGRLWRSAPCPTKSVVLGGADNRVTIVAPTLRVTGRSTVVIEAYRGIAGDDQDLHRVGMVANDPGVDTVNIVDTAGDASITALETAYFNGNVLWNHTPPGFIDTAEAQLRTWGVSADDRQALWYSKEHVAGKGIEFNEDLAVDVRDDRGALRAIAQIDGRPVAFKSDAVYAIAGSGPDPLGNGGTYAAQIVCAGIGAENAQAIVETRDGVMFKSTSTRAGFFLLDRSLSVTYIGAPVKRYDAETITASVFLSSLLQARFYTASGRTLVYDLVAGVWTTYTGQPCATAVAWNGGAVYLRTGASAALLEDMTHTTLTDGGDRFEALVGWPWVQVGQVRGYMRFFKQQPVGEVERGPVTLRMLLYRDFLPAVLTKRERETPVGTIDRVVRHSKKVGAVRTVVTDMGSTSGVLRLSGVTYQLAVKSGLRPTSGSMPGVVGG